MLTEEENLKNGRVRVTTGAEYAEAAKMAGDLRCDDGEYASEYASGFDFALSGLCQNGSFSFPYPGYYGTTGQVVMLQRDQAEHLVVELLKRLAPGEELPDDQAELLDFITTLPLRG